MPVTFFRYFETETIPTDVAQPFTRDSYVPVEFAKASFSHDRVNRTASLCLVTLIAEYENGTLLHKELLRESKFWNACARVKNVFCLVEIENARDFAFRDCPREKRDH